MQSGTEGQTSSRADSDQRVAFSNKVVFSFRQASLNTYTEDDTETTELTGDDTEGGAAEAAAAEGIDS
jgi:hypothetical protein